MVMAMEIMQVEITLMPVLHNSEIPGRMEHSVVQTTIKMVGLMSKTHIRMTARNGQTSTEMDTVTTQEVLHQMHAQEQTEIRRSATDMGALTRMAMVGMMSSMNCLV